MDTKEYYFYIDIYYTELQRHYSGHAATIRVNTEEGPKIQFPATYLRPYVTQIGIRGRFKLVLDERNEILSLEQVS